MASSLLPDPVGPSTMGSCTWLIDSCVILLVEMPTERPNLHSRVYTEGKDTPVPEPGIRAGERERFFMIPKRRHAVLPCLLLMGGIAFGQNTPAAPKADVKIDKGAAYYAYSLGHLYAELAAESGSRDYFTKAVENYHAAMKADPSASFIAEELSDLYIQSGR